MTRHTAFLALAFLFTVPAASSSLTGEAWQRSPRAFRGAEFGADERVLIAAVGPTTCRTKRSDESYPERRECRPRRRMSIAGFELDEVYVFDGAALAQVRLRSEYPPAYADVLAEFVDRYGPPTSVTSERVHGTHAGRVFDFTNTIAKWADERMRITLSSSGGPDLFGYAAVETQEWVKKVEAYEILLRRTRTTDF